MITIRLANRSDAPDIVAINETGRPGVYPLALHAVNNLLAGDAPYVCVAELDGRVVGYMIGYRAHDTYDGEEFAWFRMQMSHFFYVDQIAVTPEARRARVGSRLYDHAVDYAGAQSLTSLVCEINLDPPNPVSLHFHARLGFYELSKLRARDGRTVSLRLKRLR